MKRRVLFFSLIILLLYPNVSRATDDAQYWSRYSLKLIDTERFDYVNFWEFRVTEDISNVGLWYTSQKLIWKAHEYLDLGLNYTYLENEVLNPLSKEDEFKWQHRLEFEMNPHMSWKGKVKVQNRNRLTFRWVEDKGSDNARFRQLWGLDVPLTRLKGVRSLYTNNEYFIGFHEHKLVENRWTPVGIEFDLPGKCTLKVFYMIQSQRGATKWRSNQVLGTQVSISL